MEITPTQLVDYNQDPMYPYVIMDSLIDPNGGSTGGVQYIINALFQGIADIDGFAYITSDGAGNKSLTAVTADASVSNDKCTSIGLSIIPTPGENKCTFKLSSAFKYDNTIFSATGDGLSFPTDSSIYKLAKISDEDWDLTGSAFKLLCKKSNGAYGFVDSDKCAIQKATSAAQADTATLATTANKLNNVTEGIPYFPAGGSAFNCLRTDAQGQGNADGNTKVLAYGKPFGENVDRLYWTTQLGSVDAPTLASAGNVYYLLGVTESNTAAPKYEITTFFKDGKLYQTSDERLKTFVDDHLDVDLDNLATIKKGLFYWNNDESKTLDVGVTAQSLLPLYPELVNEADGTYAVSYSKLSVIALAAIDKLNAKIKELEAEIEVLKSSK